MEHVDATGRQSDPLPSIGHFDRDKVTDQTSANSQRNRSESAHSISNAALASPNTMYPGPPPPYSLPATANSVPALSGLISPPGSRRTSGDEKEASKSRHSLPSIQEALGREQPLPPFSASSPSSARPPSHFSNPVSPLSSIPRSHPTEQNGLPSQQSATSPYISHVQNAPPVSPRHAAVPAEAQRISLPNTASADPKLPSLHSIRTAQSPVQPGGVDPEGHSLSKSSPRYDPGPRSGESMNSSHSHYHSQYPYPQPTAAPPPVYQPPPSYSAHSTYSRYDGSEAGRVQEARQIFKGFKGINGEKYGTSVKRHLDFFDLEASLNEIADRSGRLNEFSREYKSRTHEMQSSGPQPGSMPTLAECDEMIRHQGQIQELLVRLRDLLVSQQNALASQRAQESRFKGPTEYEGDESSSVQEESKDAVVGGPEAKKRRGRAAPPGRCHSCNRAETPEWRRGPDGARTLCNACGLHYAKLTRKMGAAKASASSSSLRPKSMGPVSPQA